MHLNPYLSFNGNCETAFKFYEKATGGKILFLMNYKDTPMQGEVPAEWQEKVIHVTMKVGESHLMGSDTMPGCFAETQGMSVSLNVATPEEAEKIFQALSEDATVHMPLAETFWAQRFGMLKDKFGIPWMVDCAKKRD